VKGLLVDFGGVLTTNVFDSFKAFCRAEGLPEDSVKNMFRERGAGLSLLRRLEKGEITAAGFAQEFAPLLGVDPDNLVGRLFGGIRPDAAMGEAVRRARGAGIKTGLISNSWGEGLAYEPALLEELFDAVVISGDVGMHKPEPAIFLLGAERIRRRARGLRVRRRPARELRGRRGGGDESDPPPRRRGDPRAARGAARGPAQRRRSASLKRRARRGAAPVRRASIRWHSSSWRIGTTCMGSDPSCDAQCRPTHEARLAVG
jgi:beta-phosphoglucomutase-like phosphatase (HAD superfamily)